MTPSSTQSHAKLAIDGGAPVRATPLPVNALYSARERDAVTALMDAAITGGSHLAGYGGAQETAFCEAFAAQFGGGFADAVNSGTNAVYLALRCLDLEPGSEVITPPITDQGGVMPVVMQGCIPVIADAAPGSFNTGAEQIEACLSERTAAILVAHIGGVPADLAPIVALAAQRGIPLVEDCAQAHGATYAGRRVGAFGASAAFSTMFGKHMCTGGQGGVVYTPDEARYWRLRQVADRGKPFGTDAKRGNVTASLNFNQDEIGCAIGRVQLERLPGFVATRRELAARLRAGLAAVAPMFRLTPVPDAADPSWWFIPVQIVAAALRVDKAQVCAALAAEGIGSNPNYWHCAVDHAWFQDQRVLGARSRWPWDAATVRERARVPVLTNARATADSHFLIHIHQGWTRSDMDDVIAAFAKIAAAYAA